MSIRNCVIVGRAADYVLREDPNCLKIFLHADANAKIQRIKEREQLSEKEAEKKIAHEEKLRAANYHYYTHRMWGHAAITISLWIQQLVLITSNRSYE